MIVGTLEAVLEMKDTEGLVCIGTGGDAQEWIDGVNSIMVEQGVTTETQLFSSITSFNSRNTKCMLFEFPKDKVFSVARLAIVRLQYPWMKWLSDFKNNYRTFSEEGDEQR